MLAISRCNCFINSFLRSQSCQFVYTLSMSVSIEQQQRWAVFSRDHKTTKSKVFTVCPFTENIFQPRLYIYAWLLYIICKQWKKIMLNIPIHVVFLSFVFIVFNFCVKQYYPLLFNMCKHEAIISLIISLKIIKWSFFFLWFLVLSVETVTDFILGGSKITADDDWSHEIKSHLFLGRKVMINIDSILKSRDNTLPTKVFLVKAIVFPVVMYGCESWTIKKARHRRINAFELWCWRRLLRVPWTARRSN